MPSASTPPTTSRPPSTDTMRLDGGSCVQYMGTRRLHTEVILTLTPVDDPTDRRELKLTANAPVVIGRSSKSSQKTLQRQPSNALFDCPVISRCHAKLQFQPWADRVTIMDQNSMHGTSINEERIRAWHSVTLKSGDVLQFGEEVARGEEVYQPLSVKLGYVTTKMPESMLTPSAPVPKSNGFHVSVPSDIDSSDFDASSDGSGDEDGLLSPRATLPRPGDKASSPAQSPEPDDERSVVEIAVNDTADARANDRYPGRPRDTLFFNGVDRVSGHDDGVLRNQQETENKVQVTSSLYEPGTAYTSEPELLSDAGDWSDAASQDYYDDSDDGPEILSSRPVEDKTEASVGASCDRSSAPEASSSTPVRQRYDPVRGSPMPDVAEHSINPEPPTAATSAFIPPSQAYIYPIRPLQGEHLFPPLINHHVREAVIAKAVAEASFLSNSMVPETFPFSTWASQACDHDIYNTASSVNPYMAIPFAGQEDAGSTFTDTSRPIISARIAIDDIVDNTATSVPAATATQDGNGRKRKATALEDDLPTQEPSAPVVENDSHRATAPVPESPNVALVNSDAPRRRKRAKTNRNSPSISSKARYFAAGGFAMHLVFHYNLINLALDRLGWPRYE